MSNTKVVQATPELIEQFLTLKLRQQDINETVLLGGRTVRDVLSEVDLERTRVCVDLGGTPLALWGLAHKAWAWLIASEGAQHFALSIQRHWKKELAVLAMWAFPETSIFAVNLKATTNRRWHEGLGFVVHEENDFCVVYRRDFSWVR